jgi:outer membrane protein assembly factor BamD
MIKKFAVPAAFGCLLVVSVGCGSMFRPLESLKAESLDRRLFDRAMKAVDNSRPQEARTLLETLINTYPESEYVSRAKLVLDDIWYAEGGIGPRPESTTKAEGVTFFAPLEEAAVAKPKITNSRIERL